MYVYYERHIFYILYMIFIFIYIYIYSHRQNYGKKRFNLQALPVYDRKVTNLFFPQLLFPYFFP